MDFLTIPDQDLRGIEPQDLEALLRSIGWQEFGGVPGVSRQWILPNQRSSVVVPIDPTFEDYTRRIREVLDKVSKFYTRRPETILLEIELPGSDEITNRKYSPSIAGSIAWKAAENQIIGFRRTLIASAKAAEDKQRQFARSHPKIAREYLAQLRMGQTRPGSFIITALSPTGALPVADKGGVYEAHLGITGRDVVETLTKSLETLRTAADEFLTQDKNQIFDDTISDGVSIDLLNGLIENLGTAEGTEIAVDWNPRTLRTTGAQTSTVIFEAKHRVALTEARTRLRTLSKSVPVTILGTVTNLDRKSPKDPGVITVSVIDGTDAAMVKIQLESEYNQTVESHKSGDLIRIDGTLGQRGTQYWFTSITELALLDSRGDVRELVGPGATGKPAQDVKPDSPPAESAAPAIASDDDNPDADDS